jgi:hypothetical protein
MSAETRQEYDCSRTRATPPRHTEQDQQQAYKTPEQDTGNHCNHARHREEGLHPRGVKPCRREGKSHSMAVRALANQWVRIIYALWLKQEAYDDTIFLAAQQAHAPRAA